MSDEKTISYTCDNGCGMFCWWNCDINEIKGTITYGKAYENLIYA